MLLWVLLEMEIKHILVAGKGKGKCKVVPVL
jgi:hypothetical protein